MKLIVFLVGITGFACSGHRNQPEETGSFPTQQETEKTSVASWVKRNLGIGLDDAVFAAAGITAERFASDLSEENKELFFDPFFLGETSVNEVTTGKGAVTVNIGSDVENKYLFITNNYIIVSCHLIAGTNGRSLIYDLEKQQVQPIDMTVSKILGAHLVEAWFDYYEEGHVWETGVYDIPQKRFTHTTIER